MLISDVIVHLRKEGRARRHEIKVQIDVFGLHNLSNSGRKYITLSIFLQIEKRYDLWHRRCRPDDDDTTADRKGRTLKFAGRKDRTLKGQTWFIQIQEITSFSIQLALFGLTINWSYVNFFELSFIWITISN